MLDGRRCLFEVMSKLLTEELRSQKNGGEKHTVTFT